MWLDLEKLGGSKLGEPEPEPGAGVRGKGPQVYERSGLGRILPP